MNLIDSNFLLRYLTRDNPEKAEKCKELFKRLEFGTEKAILMKITLATCGGHMDITKVL